MNINLLRSKLEEIRNKRIELERDTFTRTFDIARLEAQESLLEWLIIEEEHQAWRDQAQGK